ncbi:MAG: YbgC/FadM family acyl-CoA thioesterase [Xanthomonadales bacterium]
MSELQAVPFVWAVRVYFEDTDAGGVVYHSKYLNFFERARTEMLRAAVISMTQLKQDHNLIWVVLEANVKFLRAARLDDELLVMAELTWMKGVQQGFRQQITRKPDGVLVATADITAAMLHADSLKPARMPAWIKAKLGNGGSIENAE